MVLSSIVGMGNHAAAAILLLIGLYAVAAKNNLIKKLVGLVIFQTAIILFYISLSVKSGTGIPIVSAQPVHVEYGNVKRIEQRVMTHEYTNPLPHVLMLTAIVVGVATLGVALALCERIYEDYGTLEEICLIETMSSES
jgi:multicomponent Na+:H+ antiporter subunit C